MFLIITLQSNKYCFQGGNVSALGELDGFNVWDTISYNKPSPRSEVLLNIDPVNEVAALRVGNYKVVQGTVYDGKWDGWYGPSGRENGTFAYTLENEYSWQKAISSSELLCVNKLVNVTDCFPAKSPCLFDVTKDPCEFNNLANEKPHVSFCTLKK